ncbi:MAG: 16S rRNA (cytosine(1402)-N(4))-methyltransferase RsmH [Firmicutes bacterium]|nr:16S rRNA (cytosine(1402)-N(4))-methyltransferase RsmH [Bacillota bacterium]
MDFKHEPVMVTELISWLNCRPGGVYIDCTLGGGGHAQAILERISPGGHLIGIDRDPAALDAARRRLAPFKDMVSIIQGNYRDLKSLLAPFKLEKIDGFVFDLGVSSHQLESPDRGFSYQQDGPLDMRMNPQEGQTASDLVNGLSEDALAGIIQKYGEERWAKRIAQFIVQARRQKPLKTTGQLVEVIKAAIPAGARRRGPHPARRTFQALRIAVNDELNSISPSLKAAVELLTPGGRLGAISFHSLEDRIVKQTFRELARGCTCPPKLPVCVCGKQPQLQILTRRPIGPTSGELERNPRARSAKLRVGAKLAVVLKREVGE